MDIFKILNNDYNINKNSNNNFGNNSYNNNINSILSNKNIVSKLFFIFDNFSRNNNNSEDNIEAIISPAKPTSSSSSFSSTSSSLVSSPICTPVPTQVFTNANLFSKYSPISLSSSVVPNIEYSSSQSSPSFSPSPLVVPNIAYSISPFSVPPSKNNNNSSNNIDNTINSNNSSIDNSSYSNQLISPQCILESFKNNKIVLNSDNFLSEYYSLIHYVVSVGDSISKYNGNINDRIELNDILFGFIDRMGHILKIEQETFISSLIYFDRVIKNGYLINSENIIKVLVSLVSISSKFNNIKHNVGTFCECLGYSTKLLNEYEVYLLKLLQYRLCVSDSEFEEYKRIMSGYRADISLEEAEKQFKESQYQLKQTEKEELATYSRKNLGKRKRIEEQEKEQQEDQDSKKMKMHYIL